MSKIEEMIKEMCPNGVDRVKLGEAGRTVTPPKKLKTEGYLEEGLYPVIDQGQDYLAGFTDDETALLANGEYVLYGDHTCSVKYINGRFAQGADGLKIIVSNENIVSKYLYYAVCAYNLQNTEYKRHWTQAKEIIIPLPPLAIQQEIVSVLDKFTDLISDIDKVIEQRQKQYEYYREKLLTFEEGECEWKKIGEIGKMIRGNGLQKSDFTEAGYPCIHYGQIHTYYGFCASETKSFCSHETASRLKKAQYGDLLIATTSEDVEACCKGVVWLGKFEVAYSGDSFCYKHTQDPKYIGYYFQTELFAKQKRKVATGAKVVRVSGDAMEKFDIPIPPLDRQRSIVATLDKFETLISDLKQMRELRQKQYEYYREKLLSFRQEDVKKEPFDIIDECIQAEKRKRTENLMAG